MLYCIKKADVRTDDGFIVALNIVRTKHPTEEKFIKRNITEVISALDLESIKVIKLVEQIPASNHSLEKSISVISDDVINNLQNDFMNYSSLNY